MFHSMYSIGSPSTKFAEFSKVYFQNFVIPWKIQISQKLILSAESSQRDPSNGVRLVYVNFYEKVKDDVEVAINSKM